MNIGIKLSISLPIVFVIHYLLISGLDRMHSIDVLTIYWAAKYYIRLRCAHNVFVRNIGPVTLCNYYHIRSDTIGSSITFHHVNRHRFFSILYGDSFRSGRVVCTWPVSSYKEAQRSRHGRCQGPGKDGPHLCVDRHRSRRHHIRIYGGPSPWLSDGIFYLPPLHDSRQAASQSCPRTSDGNTAISRIMCPIPNALILRQRHFVLITRLSE